MANKKKGPIKNKKKLKQSIFLRFGKYFLILALVLGQFFAAYSIINKNYEAIYSYTKSLMPEERGKAELKEIIVNPAGTNGQRYLLVQLSLELDSIEDQQLIEDNRSKIRNNIIKYLSAKTVSDLIGVQGKEDLRIELVRLINQAINSRSVRNLYYSKYVMQ
ncbi:flagellar basal body-associated FliL family protein [Fodinibius salsisoli]|uniref:Flagellar protein FliL n=1 Tax=Fodinibius salsisoli TaxID=2820877 RepID=A0ABT3PJL9_9BACT|nr:flagellar basal body-associated FliL family protein [Fodinibius salsisoli]MCW9705369.1 flagellar basal body-associated FliL family protein [Fodinibius salsisoli]